MKQYKTSTDISSNTYLNQQKYSSTGATSHSMILASTFSIDAPITRCQNIFHTWCRTRQNVKLRGIEHYKCTGNEPYQRYTWHARKKGIKNRGRGENNLVMHLQQCFQLGQHSLPHSRHNAGSSRMALHSGQGCFMHLIKHRSHMHK